MRWQSWQLQHWSEACVPMVFQRLVKKLLNLGPPDAAVVEKATECFHREARVLDAHLSKQPYVTGSELTLADLSIAASIAYSKVAAMPLEPYQNVQNWFARVTALPTWRQIWRPNAAGGS
jgi:glutathione S-transferase